jgi:molybdenum cofactor cytidylyltransferase
VHLPTVIVLASGRGARFAASGGTVPKLQAMLAGQTVLQHTLAAVQSSGLPWHVEVAPHPGMGDSIAAGVRACAHAHGWLILPGDLPLIQAETLRLVANTLETHAVVVPVYQGQRGHPVGFSSACATSLMNLEGNRGAAHIIKEFDAIELVVNDVGCITDIDTLSDLKRVEMLGLLPRR